MTLKVLGRASSINVRKVLWTCAELDLHFDHVESDPELQSQNPNAKIPVMQDGDFVLWESNAICRYLAAREARGTLLPNEPQARARVEQWMDWQAAELNPAWRYAFVGLVRRHADFQDPNLIAASVDAWNRHMKLLDDHLAAGGQFVTYELYRNTGRTLRWGNTLGTDTQAGTGTGTAQSQTVFGRVAPQTPNVGSYSDTVTVTVTY